MSSKTTTSSSARKPSSNVRRPKTNLKSTTSKSKRFASAKKSSSLPAKDPPTPVAAANVNKNFRSILRTSKEPKGPKINVQSSKKQAKNFIKPAKSNSTTKPNPNTATKKPISQTEKRKVTKSKTLTQSKSAKQLTTRAPKSNTSLKNDKTESKPKATPKANQKSNSKPQPKTKQSSPKQALPNSPKPQRRLRTVGRKQIAQKKAVSTITSPRRRFQRTNNNNKQNPKASSTDDQSSSNKQNSKNELPPLSPKNLKTPRNIKKRAISGTNTNTSNSNNINDKKPQQNKEEKEEQQSIVIQQTSKEIQVDMESKSDQFREKLEVFEQELVKAKKEYEAHIHRIAFQKAVWQKKYFNLLRIKSNDPMLNELAQQRKKEIQEKRLSKHGIQLLSPINEDSDNKSQQSTTVSTATKEVQVENVVTHDDTKIQTDDKQLQTENLSDEHSSPDSTAADNSFIEEELKEIQSKNDTLSAKIKKQHSKIMYHSASMIDKYNNLRKDVVNMKSEIQGAWHNWQQDLQSILLNELKNVNFISKETKETATITTLMEDIHTQTDKTEKLDISPFTSIFVSKSLKNKTQFSDAQTMVNFVNECWDIGTQTKLTEVDNQSQQVQELVDDVNEELILIESVDTSTHMRTQMQMNHNNYNNTKNKNINNNFNKNTAISTIDDSIDTKQWFINLNKKMCEVHTFRNDIDSIKNQVASLMTQSKMDFQHLSTTLHAIGKYNQNMKHHVQSLKEKNQSLQSPSRGVVVVDKSNTQTTTVNPETETETKTENCASKSNELTSQERRNQNLQYMTDNVDSTLQQIRNLYQATKHIDSSNSNLSGISPIVSNHTFFAVNHDFNHHNDQYIDNNMEVVNSPHSNQLNNFTHSESLGVTSNLHIETELDGLSQNLPISREFLSNYIGKQKSSTSQSDSQFSQWNSMVVNVSASFRNETDYDDYKEIETQSVSESLESNIDSFVENAITASNNNNNNNKKNNINNHDTYSITSDNPNNITIDTTNDTYKGKLQLLQKRMKTKQRKNSKVDIDIDNNDQVIVRPGTPISIKSSSNSISISDDMMIQSDENDTTIEELLEESVMDDRALLRKIDVLDGILDGLLSVS